MSENSEEDESEHKTVTAEVTMAGSGTMTAEGTAAFTADNIRDRLKNDEYALALVLTSTRLENILTIGLRERLETDEEQFEALWGNETLGTYGQMCSQLGVFGNTFRQGVIDNVASHRNDLVHDYGHLSDIEEDEDLQQEVEDAIEEAIGFIESVEV